MDFKRLREAAQDYVKGAADLPQLVARSKLKKVEIYAKLAISKSQFRRRLLGLAEWPVHDFLKLLDILEKAEKGEGIEPKSESSKAYERDENVANILHPKH